MDRFQEFRTFVAVAESGGFARAAAQLGASPPSVTRVVAALEARLGVDLFHRTTRSVRLTEAGARLLERARTLLASIEDAEREASGERSIPSGRLTVTASATMGRALLAPIMPAFLRAYPQVASRVMLLDRVVNLIEEGVDVALRVGALPDSSLVTRKVGEVRSVLVASPAYVKKRGAPHKPADLRTHNFLAFTSLTPNREWRYGVGKAAGRVALEPRLEINDAAAAIMAAEHGEGVTLALSYTVVKQVRSGKLVELLGAHARAPIPVQLVYAESRLTAPKLRAFVDFAAPRLRAALRDLEMPPSLKS